MRNLRRVLLRPRIPTASTAAAAAASKQFHTTTQKRFVDVDNDEEPRIDDAKIDITQYKSFKPTLVYRNTEIDVDSMPNEKMNLCTAINDAMKIAMREDETVSVFGEDVAFGGVFRCTVDLLELYGKGACVYPCLISQIYYLYRKRESKDAISERMENGKEIHWTLPLSVNIYIYIFIIYY